MRPDLQLIADLINPHARVLDLGCGDGELLEFLAREKEVTGYGVENSLSAVNACLSKGVNIIEHDLNDGLDRFPDESFDMVIMGETLQATGAPHHLLSELLRIGEECIVTFPNFAHWRCRLQLLSNGRMPVAKHLPHQWYDTPNIHLCTLTDFDQLCVDEGVTVIERYVLDHNYQIGPLIRLLPNFFASSAIYRLGRN